MPSDLREVPDLILVARHMALFPFQLFQSSKLWKSSIAYSAHPAWRAAGEIFPGVAERQP